MNKRLFHLPLFVVTMLAFVIAPTAAQDDAEDPIVIPYNAPEQWANWGGVLEAFTESTGIEAPTDPKNSGQTLAALQAEAEDPQADTAYYGIVFGIQALEAGVVEAYQPEGFEDIPDDLKDADGYWFTVHQGAIAFLVNTEELGDIPVPQCWADLLEPEYAGLVGFLDPTQAAIGYSVVTAANLALGGDFEDWTPAIEYFSELYDNGLSLPAQTATAMVQQGEIPILIDADFNGYRLANIDEAPVEVVIPCEGSLSIPYVMSLVAGAPHPDNARALLDFALSDEGQSLFAESYLRPIRSIEINEEISEALLPDEEYERVVAPDFAEMQAAQEDLTELWINEVAR